jgi:CzcA family heavy metal efflux pump
MLAQLIKFSIRYYGIVILIGLLVVLYGSYRFMTAGLDIFPEFSPKQVIIQTESPGLASEQVELLVSQQIELAISGVIGLKTVRSESIQGLSVVTALFSEDSDIYRNRQLINERLANLAAKLPQGIVPVAVPLSSSSATVMTLGLSSAHADLMTLRNLADWTIAPRLLGVSGVADVNVFGGEIKQLQIQAKPELLMRFNLSIEELIAAVRKATLIQGSGFIETINQRFTVQVTGLPITPEQLGKLAVKPSATRPVMLEEIATISYAAKPAFSQAQIMGKTGVVMMVIGQYGANTLSVSKAVEVVLKDIAPTLQAQGISFYPHLFRPADYIETSIHNLGKHLLVGGLFVLVILYSFLFNSRAAIISALAIPVSLLGAVTVLLELGINLNIMVLGGLAIALGEVVDDAIIDTENIFRRLRENRLAAKLSPVDEVVSRASLEVRSSVVYASIIVALAFVPLLTLDGIAGRLFAPLGFSYILAILFSLLVALTLTPALCHALLGRYKITSNEPPLIKPLNSFYYRGLLAISRWFKPIAVAGLLLCLAGVASFTSLEHKFLPELREGHFIVHTASIPGTSLTESIRMGSQLTERFLTIPGVESVSQWAGRAERGADTYGSHYSEYEIRLKPASGAEQQRILTTLRERLKQFPGIAFEANTFLTERIDETIAGYTAPVVVNIFGTDLTELDTQAQAVAAIMADIPGAADVQVRSPPGTPFIQVQLDNSRLAYWNVSADRVMLALQTAYETTVVGKLYQGNQLYDIALTLPPEFKSRPTAIGDLPIKTQDGAQIKLAQVTEIKTTTGRYNILRQNAQRKQTITASIISGDMDTFMATLKAKVMATIKFPANAYPEFTGAAAEQSQARHNLILHALLAGAGVLIFIYIALGNVRNMLLTLTNLPFALIGGVIAVLITGAPLSVGSVVGFITLFGITIRNTIMLLSHCHYHCNQEGRQWNFDTIAFAAQERLPSILMTALVTALAMFPIAVNSDNPGSEIMGPMAAIIIGGLLSSTILNLLIMPYLLARYGKA